MTQKADLTNASVSVLITINGQMHMVAMEKEKFEAIEMLTKASAAYVIPTGKTEEEFYNFAGYKRRE